jgi:hypothetical protein
MRTDLDTLLERARALDGLQKALARDDLDAALPLARDLVSARPDDLEAQLYAAWVRARHDGKATTAVADLATRALAERASLALPLCVLGHAALGRGDTHAAKMLFRRAADAEPASIDARRGLMLAQRRIGHGERTNATLTAALLGLTSLVVSLLVWA